jgi:hypothetical protein
VAEIGLNPLPGQWLNQASEPQLPSTGAEKSDAFAALLEGTGAGTGNLPAEADIPTTNARAGSVARRSTGVPADAPVDARAEETPVRERLAPPVPGDMGTHDGNARFRRIASAVLYPQQLLATGHLSELPSRSTDSAEETIAETASTAQARTPIGESPEAASGGASPLPSGPSRSGRVRLAVSEFRAPESERGDGMAPERPKSAHLPGDLSRWQRTRLNIVERDGVLNIWIRDYRLDPARADELAARLARHARLCSRTTPARVMINGHLMWHTGTEMFQRGNEDAS